MSNASNICLSCGLCCDGTLIGFVHLNQKELPAVSKIMTVEGAKGNGFFLQPCEKYCDGCSIYTERPQHCATFKCGLLDSVEQEKSTFDSAVETISEVKEQKRAIQRTINELQIELKSQSFYFKIVELKKILAEINSTSSGSQAHRNLSNELEQLDMLLLSKFELTLD